MLTFTRVLPFYGLLQFRVEGIEPRGRSVAGRVPSDVVHLNGGQQLILLVRETIADIYQKDPELLLTRIKLSFTVPEIRARFLNQQMTMIGPYFEQIADAIGSRRDDLQLSVTLAAVYSAMLVAVERWQRHDGREDLLRLFDDAITALAAGATDLRDTVRAAAAAGTRPKKPKAVAAKRKP